jgi:hypothetical protein
MMSISGNGFMGSSSLMVILDNIKLGWGYDYHSSNILQKIISIRVFKYRQLWSAVDYSKSDFIFLII